MAQSQNQMIHNYFNKDIKRHQIYVKINQHKYGNVNKMEVNKSF